MRRSVWLALIISLVAFPLSTRADVAPPIGPPGANPGPEGEVTQVRMVAETVLIEILESAPSGSWGRARITADFTMLNLGTQTESMAARFPIGCSDGFAGTPEIQNLEVRVDGESVATRRIDGPDCRYNLTVPWAEFDVTYPPGENVPLRVSYTLDGTGDMSLVSFYYILMTGAGWKDTIGSADLTVRLPFPATPESVFLEESTGWSTTTPGGLMSGNEIRWHYEDLEPTWGDNLEVTVVRPGYWSEVVAKRENVARNPNDGEAWGQLAKAYKDVILMRSGHRPDPGGKALYDLAIQAYEKAVTLLPSDAMWHAGLADLLAVRAWSLRWEGWDTTAEALRAMQEIQIALELAPNNARVREIAEQIHNPFADAILSEDGKYTFLWLTATPTLPAASPTAIPESTSPPIAGLVAPTSTRVPPDSPAPAASPSPETQPTPGIRLPCGSVAAVALPVAVVLATRWRLGAKAPQRRA